MRTNVDGTRRDKLSAEHMVGLYRGRYEEFEFGFPEDARAVCELMDDKNKREPGNPGSAAQTAIILLISSSSAPWCTAVYTTLLPGTSVTTASRSRILPLADNYDQPAAIKLSFPATTRARSAVGPSLSLAQRSGTHCQTCSATHRYRMTVSVASLKHSCLQTRISVHSAL